MKTFFPGNPGNDNVRKYAEIEWAEKTDEETEY
jgi:hypothetical protein